MARRPRPRPRPRPPHEEVVILPPRPTWRQRVSQLLLSRFLGRPHYSMIEEPFPSAILPATPIKVFLETEPQTENWVHIALKHSEELLLQQDDKGEAIEGSSHGYRRYRITKDPVDVDSKVVRTTHETEACIVSYFQTDSDNGPNLRDFEDRLNSIADASLWALESFGGDSDKSTLLEKAEELRKAKRAELREISQTPSQPLQHTGSSHFPIVRQKSDDLEVAPSTGFWRRFGFGASAQQANSYRVPIGGLDRVWLRFAKRRPWFDQWQKLREAVENTYEQPKTAKDSLARVKQATKICASYLTELVIFANQCKIPLTVKHIRKAESEMMADKGMPALLNVYKVDDSLDQFVSYTQPMGSYPPQLGSDSQSVEKTIPSTLREVPGTVVNLHSWGFGVISNDEKNDERVCPLMNGIYRHGSLSPIALPISEQQEGTHQALETLLKQIILDQYRTNPQQFLNKRGILELQFSLLGLLTPKNKLGRILSKVAEGYTDFGQIDMTRRAVEAYQVSKTAFSLTEILNNAGIDVEQHEDLPDIRFDINFMNWPSNPMSVDGMGLRDVEGLNDRGIRVFTNRVVKHLKDLLPDEELIKEPSDLKEAKAEIVSWLDTMAIRESRATFMTEGDQNKFGRWFAEGGILTRLFENETFKAGSKEREFINFLQLTLEALLIYNEGPDQEVLRGFDFQWRFCMIGRMMGDVVSHFCKSGEDRTSKVPRKIEQELIKKHRDPFGRFSRLLLTDDMIDNTHQDSPVLKDSVIADRKIAQQISEYSCSQQICGLNVPGARATQDQSPMLQTSVSQAVLKLATMAKNPYKQAQKSWSLRWQNLKAWLSAPVAWLGQQLRRPFDFFVESWHSWQVKRDEYQSLKQNGESLGLAIIPEMNNSDDDRSVSHVSSSPSSPHRKKQASGTAFFDHRRSSTSSTSSIDHDDDVHNRKWSFASSTDEATLHLAPPEVVDAANFVQKNDASPKWEKELTTLCEKINQTYRNRNSQSTPSQDPKTVSPKENYAVSMRKRGKDITLLIADLFNQNSKQSRSSAATQAPDTQSVKDEHWRQELIDLWILTLFSNGITRHSEGTYQATSAEGSFKPPVLKLTIGPNFKGDRTLRETLRAAFYICEFLNAENKRYSKGESAIPVELKVVDNRGDEPRHLSYSQNSEQLKKLMRENESEVKSLQNVIRDTFGKHFQVEEQRPVDNTDLTFRSSSLSP